MSAPVSLEKDINMRLRPLLPLLLLFFTACVPTPIPADTGIEGSVTIGPMCPVARVNNPCPDKPYQATIMVLIKDQRKVTQFQTDANGYFHVALAPGEYILHPESPNVMPHSNDIQVSVVRGQYTRVDVSYDSGIR